jgi:hypothetical protein
MEADQTLVIDGNLFVDGGGDPVVATLGVYQVLVKSVVPVQAQGISTAGGTVDVAAIAAAVLAQLQATAIPVDVAKMNGAVVIGDGSEANAWRGVGVSA